jgi:DNA polymerase-1
VKIIFDLNNLTARAYYINKSGNYLSRSDGKKTGVVYVSLKSVKHIVDKFTPEEVIFVSDKGISQYRREIYPEYKANRRQNQTEEEKQDFYEYIDQIKRLEEYLKSLGHKVIRYDKTEADDIIAYITELEKDMSKYMLISTDTDFFQLLPTGLMIFDPVKEMLITDEYIKEKFGIEKEQYIFYKSMIGDKTDNVDAVSGFGSKAAVSLLPVKNLSELKEKALPFSKKKKYQAFIDNFNVIERNYKLISLEHVVLPEDAKSEIENMLKISQEPSQKEFDRLCQEDEFNLNWEQYTQKKSGVSIDSLFAE